jgi:lipopolysaccharide heptosyltransferase II
MKVERQRKIDRVVGKVICRILSVIPKKDGSAAEPSRILVILLSEMGSLLLAKPMFNHIRERYKQASLHVLCFERNREFLDIVEPLPSSHVFTVRGESLWELLKDSLRVLAGIRKSRIDTVLDCELFSRISSIYSFLSGARIRVGFHPHTQEGLYRGGFINRPVLYNPYLHMSHQFINLVEAIGSTQKPTVKRCPSKKPFSVPQMEVKDGEKEAMWKRLTRDFPQIFEKKLVLIYPSGGLLPIRAWPLNHFCVVAENILDRGYAVGIIGMEEDKMLAERLLSHCKSDQCIDLTGYTKTVRELMILFHFASLLITNDGGPGHFAAMTPVPAIVLYGPETPALYGPMDSKSRTCYVPLSCSPCLTAYNHRHSPCDGDNRCLKAIHPDMVVKMAYEILEQGDQSPAEERILEARC